LIYSTEHLWIRPEQLSEKRITTTVEPKRIGAIGKYTAIQRSLHTNDIFSFIILSLQRYGFGQCSFVQLMRKFQRTHCHQYFQKGSAKGSLNKVHQ
jgi:hypothetical protein